MIHSDISCVTGLEMGVPVRFNYVTGQKTCDTMINVTVIQFEIGLMILLFKICLVIFRFQLPDFNNLLTNHDERLANRLNAQYLKEEWEFPDVKIGNKSKYQAKFKDETVVCGDSRAEMVSCLPFFVILAFLVDFHPKIHTCLQTVQTLLQCVCIEITMDILFIYLNSQLNNNCGKAADCADILISHGRTCPRHKLMLFNV